MVAFTGVTSATSATANSGVRDELYAPGLSGYVVPAVGLVHVHRSHGGVCCENSDHASRGRRRAGSITGFGEWSMGNWKSGATSADYLKDTLKNA
jgi:hypothetical protein